MLALNRWAARRAEERYVEFVWDVKQTPRPPADVQGEDEEAEDTWGRLYTLRHTSSISDAFLKPQVAD